MFKLTKEITLLTEIAACISSDKFILLERKISKFFNQNYNPEKLYEVILQSYLFCGFPSTIESLKIYRKYYSDTKTPKAEYDFDKFKSSGISNGKLIYKKNYKKLIENMFVLSPDLKEWMLIEGYGKVFGRKGIRLQERELMNVSFLSAHYFEIQLHSHLQGCLNLNIQKNIIEKVLSNLINISGKHNTIRSLALFKLIAK